MRCSFLRASRSGSLDSPWRAAEQPRSCVEDPNQHEAGGRTKLSVRSATNILEKLPSVKRRRLPEVQGYREDISALDAAFDGEGCFGEAAAHAPLNATEPVRPDPASSDDEAEPVELKLANATDGTKRKRCATAEPKQAAPATSETTLAELQQAVSRARTALVTAEQAASVDCSRSDRAGRHFDTYEGRGVDVFEDRSYLAAERAVLAADADWEKSSREALYAHLKLQSAELRLCREVCARLQARNEQLSVSAPVVDE